MLLSTEGCTIESIDDQSKDPILLSSSLAPPFERACRGASTASAGSPIPNITFIPCEACHGA